MLDKLREHAKAQSPGEEVLKTIEKASPKTTGLRRLIPSADQAGVLALVVAIMSLANDLTVNWLVPLIDNSGNTKPPASPGIVKNLSCWVDIESITRKPDEMRSVYPRGANVIVGDAYHRVKIFVLHGKMGRTKREVTLDGRNSKSTSDTSKL